MKRLLEQLVRELILEISPGALISSTSQKIQNAAANVVPVLSRVDRKNSVWTYDVEGSEGRIYTVKVKIPRISKKSAALQDVRVSCDCDFFRWQGPEHWGLTQGYLYKSPTGSASPPVIRDPNQEKKLCKHAVAALERFQVVKL